MPVVTQHDYIKLDEKEIQLALQLYVKSTYNREVSGKFSIAVDYDRNQLPSYKARADLV